VTPTQEDHPHVQITPQVLGNTALELVGPPLGERLTLGYPPQSLGDSMTMDIDGKDGPVERVQQHTACRLGADAWQQSQKLFGLVRFHLFERGKCDLPKRLPESRRDGRDHTRFLVVQTALFDARSHVLDPHSSPMDDQSPGYSKWRPVSLATRFVEVLVASIVGAQHAAPNDRYQDFNTLSMGSISLVAQYSQWEHRLAQM
jgi:hypothetical protein